jgi:ribonuclease-3
LSFLRIFSKDRELYASLKSILGFYPGSIEFYKQAFRHSSAAREIRQGVKDSNERLEFLGDAVLGTVIGEYLFKMFPYKDEGFLTKMRSKIVSRAELNKLAHKLGLDTFLEKNIGHDLKNKSIYGDAFEALIGAVYLDKGFAGARNFIITRIIKYHIDIEEVEARENDYKSKLVEWTQKEKKSLRFSLVQEIGFGQDKQFLIEVLIDNQTYGSGQHYSKKRAEQIAAEIACGALEI